MKARSPRRVRQGAFTKARLPRHVYQGAFTKARTPRRVHQGAFTKACSPRRRTATSRCGLSYNFPKESMRLWCTCWRASAAVSLAADQRAQPFRRMNDGLGILPWEVVSQIQHQFDHLLRGDARRTFDASRWQVAVGGSTVSHASMQSVV